VGRLVLLVVLVAAVTAPTALAATTYEVTIRDNAYDPAAQAVASGDTVRWTNRGINAHTVTFATGRNDVQPGQSIRITFSTPGTYSYRCEFHDVMKGTVVVQAASVSSSTTSTTRLSTTTSTTQDARGSAITAPPDTSTTSTSSTTSTTLPAEETTTTAAGAGGEGAVRPPLQSIGDDIDGPGAVAALLLLATSGAAFLQARTALR
jgi:plastocyanin